MSNYCLDSCAPAQVININQAIDDFSNIEVIGSNGVLCKECLDYSYSLDGINWSCWLKYEDAANILFDIQGDYYIRIQVNDSVNGVKIDGVETQDYSTSLAKCFDFTNLAKVSANMYNPYSNMEAAIGLYQALSDTVSNIVGIPIYYIKLTPNIGSTDITFKEYALMDVEAIKQIKLIIKDGQMPSSKPEFSDFGFDFSTDWETEISKNVFASAFGVNAKPMEGDLIYIPMMKRMWMVNNTYDEKNEGLMWQSTVFKLLLVKYEDKGSVDLGNAQSFVDGLVKTKYEDLFGTEENNMSGQDTVSSPTTAFSPLYPVYQSDAVRKYVKMSDDILQINTKLVNFQTYHNNILCSENAYDWSQVIDESYIIYQKQYCGTDATVSFIINTGTNYCKGSLLQLGNIDISIDITPTNVSIQLLNLVSIDIKPNTTYLVYGRWSKSMNIIELGAIEYVAPKNMPSYLVQEFNKKFDLTNIKNSITKYDIELEQSEKKDVITYSFDGKITNIKIYDSYIGNLSELIQMYPTNQRLIINDAARKFVELTGLRLN
jgi:hypothetical protein